MFQALQGKDRQPRLSGRAQTQWHFLRYMKMLWTSSALSRPLVPSLYASRALHRNVFIGNIGLPLSPSNWKFQPSLRTCDQSKSLRVMAAKVLALILQTIMF